MNASDQLYSALIADTGVMAIATVVRPVHLADNDELPAIVYQIINTRPIGSLQGDTSNLDHVRMQIDAWAMDYPTAVDLGTAIRNALRPRALVDALVLVDDGDPQTAVPRDSLIFARIIDQTFDYNTETRRHRCRMDFYIWQRPQQQE